MSTRACSHATEPLTIKVVRPHYKIIGPAVMDNWGSGYDVDHGPSAEAVRQERWFEAQERPKRPRVHHVARVR